MNTAHYEPPCECRRRVVTICEPNDRELVACFPLCVLLREAAKRVFLPVLYADQTNLDLVKQSVQLLVLRHLLLCYLQSGSEKTVQICVLLIYVRLVEDLRKLDSIEPLPMTLT